MCSDEYSLKHALTTYCYISWLGLDCNVIIAACQSVLEMEIFRKRNASKNSWSIQWIMKEIKKFLINLL